MKTIDSQILAVKAQYEKLPYPPVPFFAIPTGQKLGFCYEEGMEFLSNKKTDHSQIRILVVGAGTLEAMAVALAHPKAHSVTAIDISQKSIGILKLRNRLFRASRLLKPLSWKSKKAAPLVCLVADIMSYEPKQKFDLIYASNVLHHLPDPGLALQRIAQWLTPEGLIRLTTYPKASRLWVREAKKWLKQRNFAIGANPKEALPRVRHLPSGHPVRSIVLTHPERLERAGLTDAFLHTLENPLSPLEWQQACIQANLYLIGESQIQTSSSSFLSELFPACKKLNRWEKLQILDDLQELMASPILWLSSKRELIQEKSNVIENIEPQVCELKLKEPCPLTPEGQGDFLENLARAQSMLAPLGISLEHALVTLREKVGLRETPFGKPLRGLTAWEYVELPEEDVKDKYQNL